jgi:glycosyltransferase involved in cell wall biosynthesis
LGVETNLFNPKLTIVERNEYRSKMGFNDDDVVCLYAGKFTDSKGPLILAKAVNYLYSKGHTKIKALFVGQGSEDYLAEMQKNNNCFFHSFVNSHELVNFYCAFDIGVWPLQESTSQLDAAACGMPIIISNKVEDVFRIDNNGLSYKQGDIVDLAQKILMLSEPDLRKKMGRMGIEKIQKYYSWEALAINKIADFNKLR